MTDPILDEIYEVRAKLAKEHGYDVRKFCKALRRDAKQLIADLRNVKPKAASKTKVGGAVRVGKLKQTKRSASGTRRAVA